MKSLDMSPSQFAGQAIAHVVAYVAVGAIWSAIAVTPLGSTIALFTISSLAFQILESMNYAISQNESQFAIQSLLSAVAIDIARLITGISLGIFGPTGILVYSIMAGIGASIGASRIPR